MADLRELTDRMEFVRRKLDELRGFFDVEGRKRELEELEALSASPTFWDDPNKARASIEKANQIKSILNPFDQLLHETEEVAVLLDLAAGEPEGPSRDETLREAQERTDRLEDAYKRFELQTLLSGRFDANNAYLDINAGAGGTESCDWAAMLLRMYTRYCEKRGFRVDLLDMQRGDEAGIKSASLLVSGPYAYGYLKAERGVHRLVRISPFDANKRRHTSFAAVDVVAEVDENVEIDIQDKDLRIDTFRSSGAGGQHVNKTDSAVRIVHIPTGIVVQCQAERSQHANRDKAMKMLRAKLYEYEMDKKRREMEKFYGEKGEIAWGRQIRSYVLQPYTMVKDHRTDFETGQADLVLDGDLDGFIEAYLRSERAKA
ncbi:MAG: peptide chain release factor 2 [Kiritimatiellae bacterium]|nr:peptide chain release factor 2 [Kiritimatiellia bacterium]MDW8458988.1 peptide chain release factor 2 [Verrucomicrobiota bacterium]